MTSFVLPKEGINGSNGLPPLQHENVHNHENGQMMDEVESGPYLYDLFAIMIHSGSASGGHYYAYIKDFKTEEWSCFNDQCVSPVRF